MEIEFLGYASCWTICAGCSIPDKVPVKSTGPRSHHCCNPGHLRSINLLYINTSGTDEELYRYGLFLGDQAACIDSRSLGDGGMYIEFLGLASWRTLRAVCLIPDTV